MPPVDRLLPFIICCLSVIFFNGIPRALCQEIEESPEAIPALPPEESPVVKAEEADKEEEAGEIMSFEPSRGESAFFTDNGFSMGPSRNMNMVDIGGYLRMRGDYVHNGPLKTYIPRLQRGTSNIPPNLSLFNSGKATSPDGGDEGSDQNPAENRFSANMRLRLDPTINVSEVVRIKSTVDVFDNMVLGSTPSYLISGAANPSWPSSVMSLSQNVPMRGVNSLHSAIRVKRAWGEVNFPIGELRFGRMPFHWGLGILYNSGDDLSNNYGDQIDGIFFTTRIFDYYIQPGYSIAYSGPVGRGGGQFPTAENHLSAALAAEDGQRYALESSSFTHVFMLSFLKRESDYIMARKRSDGQAIFNYGILGSYRRQYLDAQAYSPANRDLVALSKSLVKRRANVGLASLWSAFSISTFHLEAEAVGIWGKYEIGHSDADMMAKRADGTTVDKSDVWLLQAGLALKSKYGFLNDRLQVGFDGGWASAGPGPGLGLREGVKLDPKAGDADGFKRGDSGYKSNFRFNPAYGVDLLLHREVLGGISGTVYLKPHIAYFFSRNFGIRGDVISSLAQKRENTTGNSHWLGLELDGSAFLRTESGFYFQLAYGVLFPMKGLDHRKTDDITAAEMKVFGESRMAQTVQTLFGITF